MNPYEQYPLITKIMRAHRDECPQDFCFFYDAEWKAAEANMDALGERIKGFVSRIGSVSENDKETLRKFLYDLNAACEDRENVAHDYGFFDGFATALKFFMEASTELQLIVPDFIPNRIPNPAKNNRNHRNRDDNET